MESPTQLCERNKLWTF